MKKLLAVILIFTAAGLTFGEFRFEVYGEIEPDLLQVIKPIGDPGDLHNTNNIPYQGGPRVDFFTGGVFNPGGGFMDVNKLYLRMSYWKDFYDASVRVNGNKLVEWNKGFFADESSTGADPLTDGSIGKLLDALVDEYHIRGDIGPFRVWFGNMDTNQGNVDLLNNYSPALYARVEDFGITIPSAAEPSYFNLGGVNFVELVTRSPHRTINYLPQNITNMESKIPYILFSYSIDNIDINLGTHLQGPVNAQVNNDYAFSTFEANAYFRVSGKELFDLIDFDFIYRIRGVNQNIGDSDPAKIYTAHWAVAAGQQTRKNDGEGGFGHSIGLFAQPLLSSFVNGLDLSVGYSVFFQTLEKFDAEYALGAPAREIKRKAPVFNGIDLRASYGGIDKFLFTTQHNFSFASITGSDPAEVMSYGLLPAASNDYLPADNINRWFYFYNSIGVQYPVTELFSAQFGIANRCGIFSQKSPGLYGTDIIQIKNNWLSVDLMGSWILARGAWELWAGFSLLHQYSTIKSNIYTENDVSGGRLVFAIPIRVVWSIAK
ncbi:MAG: hypothetical protein FWD21_03310 [Peptococcaceae bacterium]|nr:hypothetical protein [Peptococcaceae bacterium]